VCVCACMGACRGLWMFVEVCRDLLKVWVRGWVWRSFSVYGYLCLYKIQFPNLLFDHVVKVLGLLRYYWDSFGM
jgi:hypothetical protein